MRKNKTWLIIFGCSIALFNFFILLQDCQTEIWKNVPNDLKGSNVALSKSSGTQRKNTPPRLQNTLPKHHNTPPKHNKTSSQRPNVPTNKTRLRDVNRLPRDISGMEDLTKQYMSNVHPPATDILTLIGNVTNVKPQFVGQKRKRVSPNKEDLIPNVVYFINFGCRYMSFLQLTSYLSAWVILKPDYVFIFGDCIFQGPNWQQAVAHIENLVFVRVTRSGKINGRPASYLEHSTDFLRIKTILNFGGLYIDDDVLLVRSIDALRNHQCVMGRQNPDCINSGIIMAKRHAPFLRLWLEGYRDYRPQFWDYNAVQVPHKISQIFPHLIHVEKRTLNWPNYSNRQLLFEPGAYLNWTDNYMLHVFKRDFVHKIPRNYAALKHANHAVGAAMRRIHDLVEEEDEKVKVALSH